MITKRMNLWDGRDDVALYTYVTELDPMFPAPEQKLPALVVCPGGAYVYYSQKNEGDAVAMNFAAAGYQVFILKYTTGMDCKDHSCKYPAQLLDFGKALLTINEHADEWFVDVNRIGIIGFSAGAHLCATLATRWHEPLLKNYFEVDSRVFKPAAVVLGYPLTDYQFQEDYNATQPVNPMLVMSNKLFFGTEHPTKEQLEEVSPYLHVSDKTPPVFMMHAQNDTMVPVTHSYHMAQALHEHKIPYELHIFQDGEHGFSTGVPLDASDYRIDRYRACRQWIPLAQKWLLHIMAPETAEHDIPSAELFKDDQPMFPPFLV